MSEQPEHEEARRPEPWGDSFDDVADEARMRREQPRAVEHEEARRLASKEWHTAIEALRVCRAERAKAEQERDEAQKAWAAETRRATEHEEGREAAERELERLRTTLHKIAYSEGGKFELIATLREMAKSVLSAHTQSLEGNEY